MTTRGKISTNKLAEIFYNLSLREDFQKDVLKLRKTFSIPEEGYPTMTPENAYKFGELFHSDLLKPTLRKFGLPYLEDAELWLELYVLCNNLDAKHVGTPNAPFLALRFPREQEMEEAMRPFVKLYIFDGASKSEADRYLKERWGFVKTFFRNARIKQFGDQKERRVRPSRNKKRDERIYQLYQKSNKELGVVGREPKYARIATLIKKEGFGEVDPDNVRRIYARQRKLRGLA